MSNRTFACLQCRKLQRRDQNTKEFFCPQCGQESIRVHWKLHVPAPRKLRKWNSFWERYLLELRQIEEFRSNTSITELHLPLLNQVLRRAPK
jgi:DNA-directed RNA polymerase subunit RPC12/RpoP